MARNIVISIRDGSVSCVYGLDADDRVIVSITMFLAVTTSSRWM
jgi:hypothetical protein